MALTTLTKIGKGITSLFKAKGATHARELEDRFSDVINVKDYGAVGDGVVDDSDAFIAASLSAVSSGKKVINIPAGNYLLTKEGSMNIQISSVTNGFTWQGSGMGCTVVTFSNESLDPDNYLISNTNKELRVNYKGIRFNGNPSTKNSKFYYMTSNNQAQSIRFWDCMWYQFHSIMYIEGLANASELLYVGCKTSNIYSKAYVVDNVQSLNHNFYGCDFEVHYDDIFYFKKGGILNFFGGSLILSDDPDLGSSGAVIHTEGSNSNIGANNWNYNFHGVRTELHGTSTLVNQQSAGKITFTDSNIDVITGDKNRFIASINEEGWVRFSGGHVNGHFYLIGNSSSAYATPWRLATLQVSDATLGDSYKVSRKSLGITGGMGRCRVSNCKRKQQGGGSYTEVFDEDLGFSSGWSGQSCSEKFAVLSSSRGTLPKDGDTFTLKIPIGSIIKSVRMVHEPSAGSANLTYLLKNDNGTKTFNTWTFNSQDSINSPIDMWNPTGSLDRTIKLTSSGVSTNYAGYVVVSYI